MKHYKPIPIFDQVKSSDQEKPTEIQEEWKILLKKALEQKPEKMDFFYIPVHVQISHLPPDALYKKIIEDMEFLKKEFSSQFEFCVERLINTYQESIDPPPAEIIPFQKGGALC